MKTHTFIARVEDKPGVINRIASLFRRRGFNIASLTVGRTAEPGVSRLTLVVEADEDTARRIEANLYKLVNVLLVEDVTYAPSLARELALIKVRADATTRPRILQVCEVFGARVIDLTAELVTIELTATHDKIDDLVGVLSPEGVLEMVRTGVVAMTRGAPSPISSSAAKGTSSWPASTTTAKLISV